MDNHLTLYDKCLLTYFSPNIVKKKDVIKKDIISKRKELRRNYQLAFNDKNSFFKSNDHSKDKLESISYSQQMMSKFKKMCKIYSSSLKLNKPNYKKTINQINDERLISNRIPRKKNLVTNISLNNTPINNKIVSRNIANYFNSSKMHILKKKSSNMTSIHVSDNTFREENAVSSHVSMKASEYDINLSHPLIKANESKDKRCNSASSSFCLKKKLKISRVLHLLPRKQDQNELKVSNTFNDNKTQSNKPKLTRKKTLITVQDKKEVDNANIDINDIVGIKETINISNDSKQITPKSYKEEKASLLIINQLEQKQEQLKKESQQQQQFKEQQGKTLIDDDKPNIDSKDNDIINRLKINKDKENNENVNESKEKKDNNMEIKNNNNIDINNSKENCTNDEDKYIKTLNNNYLEIKKKEVVNQSKSAPSRKVFKKSKTIVGYRQKKNKNSSIDKNNDSLLKILQEAEMNQIEKRRKEMTTEFPMIMQNEKEDEDSIKENNKDEKETLLNNIHIYTEDDDFESNEHHQHKVSKTTKNSNQIEIFSFKMLKNDTQDTVPTSRISDAEKHDFPNEYNLSDYNSSVHSLNIASIIAKNKKSSIYLKNYMTQLSKISEFSHQEALKNLKESSSDHRSIKSNQVGEFEPISPVISPKIYKRAITITYDEELFKRCQKKYKTEIPKVNISNDYYSSQSECQSLSEDQCKVAREKPKRTSFKSYCSFKEYRAFSSGSNKKMNISKSFLHPCEVIFDQSSFLNKLETDIEYSITNANEKAQALKKYLFEKSFEFSEKKLDGILPHEEVPQKELEKIDLFKYYVSSLPKKKENNIIVTSYIKKAFILSEPKNVLINRSYIIENLQHNYFDFNVVKKLVIEQYFQKDLEMTHLPTLLCNFTDNKNKNISFKRRKMNVISRNVPYLIKLTPDCINFYNVFISYDYAYNTTLNHNKCTDKSVMELRSKNEESPVTPSFRIKRQNKQSSLTKNSILPKKSLHKLPSRKYKTSISNAVAGQTARAKDTILKANFYKRHNQNVSHESNEEYDGNFSKEMQKRKTILLSDPFILLKNINKGAKTNKHYDEISIFNKNKVLIKTNKIKTRILNSLKSQIETLFFYIKDRNYPQFKETYEKYLIDPEIKDYDGNSLLSLAVQCNCFQIVNFLLNMGSDPNELNKNSNSPLHYALTFHYFEIADMLIKRGADETIQNKRGLTPWQCLDSAISIV